MRNQENKGVPRDITLLYFFPYFFVSANKETFKSPSQGVFSTEPNISLFLYLTHRQAQERSIINILT